VNTEAFTGHCARQPIRGEPIARIVIVSGRALLPVGVTVSRERIAIRPPIVPGEYGIDPISRAIQTSA
jgi:hypothetical protein